MISNETMLNIFIIFIIISIFIPIKVLSKYFLVLPIIGNLLIFTSIFIKSIIMTFSYSSEKPQLNDNKKEYYDEEYDEYYCDEQYEDAEYEDVPDIAQSELSEKNYVLNLIDELKHKSNKTQKDKDNLSLLDIKLQQMINKK